MRTFVALAALLALAAPAEAQPGRPCPHEVFPIGGQAVTVTVCAAPSGGGIAVSEVVKSSAGTVPHSATIQPLPGASVARTVDDIPLSALTLPYTLHLTLAYRVRDAQIAIEHALLLPGARPLK